MIDRRSIEVSYAVLSSEHRIQKVRVEVREDTEIVWPSACCLRFLKGFHRVESILEIGEGSVDGDSMCRCFERGQNRDGDNIT